VNTVPFCSRPQRSEMLINASANTEKKTNDCGDHLQTDGGMQRFRE
jgi:hypothetical protein